MRETPYKIGDIVCVKRFYDDMIIRGQYTGLILGIDRFEWTNFSHPNNRSVTEIFSVLNLETNEVMKAEAFAISYPDRGKTE